MKNSRGVRKSSVKKVKRVTASKKLKNSKKITRTIRNIKNRQEDSGSSGQNALVVIDGTDVAMNYGKGSFSVMGIQIALRKYQEMQCEAIAIVPQKTMKKIYTDNHALIHALVKRGQAVCAPGKNLPNGTITECNPHRFILDAAVEYNARVLSNSNFDEISHEKDIWRNLIHSTRLQRYKFNGSEIVLE